MLVWLFVLLIVLEERLPQGLWIGFLGDLCLGLKMV